MARGSPPFSTFPSFAPQDPWHCGEKLTIEVAMAAPELLRRRTAAASNFGRPKAIGAPELPRVRE